MSRDDNHHELTQRSGTDLFTRRAVLAATGAVGLTGLAGCAGDTDDEGSGGDSKTFKMVQPTSFNPNKSNFLAKPFRETNPKGYHGSWNEAFFARTRPGSPFSDDIPHIASQKVTRTDKGCTKEVKLIDGLKWWDGTPVTGKGLKYFYDIKNFQDYGPNPGDKPNRTIEVVGDGVYRHHYRTSRNDYSVKVATFDSHQHHPKWYKKWWQKYKDATSKEETESITSELSKQRITMKQLKEDGLGSGLYKPSDWSDTTMTWKKVKDHTMADVNNIDRWKWEMVPDRTKRIEQYKMGKYDALSFGDIGNVPLDQVPGFKVQNSFTYNSSISLRFNMDRPIVGDRAFRQAIGYLLDFKELANNLSTQGFPAKTAKWTTGAPRKTSLNWFGEEWLGKLIDHGQTAQKNKATKTLQAAGYTKQGGSWVSPDGKQVKGLKFVVPKGGGKMQKTGQYISGALKNFGIKNDLFVTSSPKVKEARENADHDMMLWFPFAGPGNGHPVDTYIRKWGTLDNFDKVRTKDYSKPQPKGGCGGTVTFKTVPYTKKKGPYFKVPVHDEFPAEVGRNDLNGKTQQLKPLKWKYESQQASNDRIAELGKKLAWYCNFSMARINVWDEVTKIVGDSENYTWKDSLEGRRKGLTKVHRITPQIAGGRVQRK